MLELHFAAAGAGAALVGLSTHLVASELMHILVDSEPSVVFAAARFANLIRETGELLGDARLEMPPVVWIVDPVPTRLPRSLAALFTSPPSIWARACGARVRRSSAPAAATTRCTFTTQVARRGSPRAWY